MFFHHDIPLILRVQEVWRFGTLLQHMTMAMTIMVLPMVTVVLVLIIDCITPVSVPSHHEFVQIIFCNYFLRLQLNTAFDLSISMYTTTFQITRRSLL